MTDSLVTRLKAEYKVLRSNLQEAKDSGNAPYRINVSAQLDAVQTQLEAYIPPLHLHHFIEAVNAQY